MRDLSHVLRRHYWLERKCPQRCVRIRTPPYVSNRADVRHVVLDSAFPDSAVELQPHGGAITKPERFIILCSDGLVDLYDDKIADSEWARVVGEAFLQVSSDVSTRTPNPALALLRAALGGTDGVLVSRMLTVEMTSRWMDDTTIVVLRL